MSDDPPTSDDRSDPFNRATGLLGRITAVIAAAVALNTGIAGWFEQSISRTDAFREAVTAEETFWSGLHSEYVATFNEDDTDTLRDEKRLALCSLSNRTPADFREYSDFVVPEGMKSDAAARIRTMRAFLRSALLDPETSGKTVADKCRASDYAAVDDATEPRLPDGSLSARTNAGVVSALISVPGAIQQTEVISAGRANGWDVDVFWCQGENETTNRDAARRAAFKLVGDDVRLDHQVLLGRVRLRGLPVSRQAAEGISARTPFVAWDRGNGEKAAADAVVKRLNAPPGEFTFEEAETGTTTLWYLSVFVCNAQADTRSPEIAT